MAVVSGFLGRCNKVRLHRVGVQRTCVTCSSRKTLDRAETKASRGAMARVALASKVARTSDKQGSKDKADASNTVDCSVISCATFLAEM